MKNFFKKHFTKKRIIAFFVIRKIIALILIFSFVMPPKPAEALVPPVANYVINRAIAGAVAKNLMRRGIAANDPRYIQTMQSISGTVTTLNVASTAATVALTIAGAPVWLTIAATVGIFALGAYMFSDKSKLTVTDQGIKYDPAQSLAVPYVPAYPIIPPAPATFLENYIRTGQKVYQGTPCFTTQICFSLPKMPANYDPMVRIEIPSQAIEGSAFATGQSIVAFDSLEELSAGLLVFAFPPDDFPKYNLTLNNAAHPKTQTFFSGAIQVTDYFNWVVPPYIDVAQNGLARVVAQYSSNRQCLGSRQYCDIVYYWSNSVHDYVSDDPAIVYRGLISPVQPRLIVSLENVVSTYQDADSFNEQLTPYQRSQPLTNATIAKLADAIWRESSLKPGYIGEPYTNLDPITETDVQEYLMNRARPTVGDLLRPATSPDSDQVPIGEVGTGSGNSTGGLIKDVNVMNSPDVKVINKIKIDFGDAPNTPQPNDWGTPSLDSIFEPFRLSILGHINPFDGVPHGGECPRPAIDLFGKTIVLDAHCSLMTDYAVTVALVLTLAYAYLAATIVLSA